MIILNFTKKTKMVYKIILSKSLKNLVFEIKTNNQIKKITPIDLNIENNNQMNYMK